MADSDITGAADWLAQQNQAAHAAAIPQPDDDPDRAARALDLSGATGVPATAIYHDQDNFEAQHKQALTQQLLKDNDFLRQFAVSHPLAPKIAADDWHNLDAMVDKLEKLGIPRPGKGVEVPAAKGVVDATVKGFSEGWGEGHLGDWMLSNQADADFIKNNPQAFGTMWLSMRALGDPIEIAMRGFNAAITGGAAGIREAYITAGGNEAQANRLTRDLIAGAQVAAAGQGGMGIHPEMVAKIAEAARMVEPYVKAGERPPVGIHPEIDKAYHEEAKIDIKNLDEAKKAVQATATAERAPELLIQNLKEKYGQGTIGVSADAIRALYGDKLPEPDDNILGWVEGLQEKLTTAEATGGDVQIPLADWLVKADPEVAKELHDHIRVRQGGMTLDEAKNMPKAEELKAANDTMEDIRGPYDELAKKVEAGEELTPEEQELVWKHGGQISDLVGRKGHLGAKPELKLVKPAEDIEPQAMKEVAPGMKMGELTKEELQEFGYSANDERDYILERAKRIAAVFDKDYANKDAAVQRLQEMAGEAGLNGLSENARDFKKAAEILRNRDNILQLKPDEGIEPIAAREEEPNPQQEAVDTVRKSASLEPLNDRLEELIANDVRAWHAEQIAKLHNEGAFETFSYKDGKPNLVGYVKKSEFYKEHEEALVAKAMEVMDRIAPQHLGALVDTHGVKIGGEKVQGAYQQYRDRLPAILYDLTGEDPIGTVRHEAIHHLRQLGFFTDREWQVLSRTAIADKWLEKHNIDTRYEDFPLEGRIEEAIAEEFRDWRYNPDSPHAAGGIFEKLQEFIDAIKKWIKEKGGEPTADYLFAMVETGEIGRRKPTGPKQEGVYNPEPLAAREPEDIVQKASALGMTEKEYRLHMKHIAKLHEEDIDRQTELAAKDIRKRQTAEWKENEARVRDEVDTDIRQRPDMLADKFFRTGEIGSGRTAELPKLDASRLSPEQKAALPKEYYGRGGLSPDSVAGLFGYQSGEAMVNRLGILNEARKANRMTPEEDFKATVDRETERRMQQQYGNLEENVLKEAEDYICSPTQMDILHEQVVGLGVKAGLNLPLGKGDLAKAVPEDIGKMPIGSISRKSFLADAGRAGQLMKIAALEGKNVDAFKQSQRQYMAMLYAKEAGKIEKAKDQFDKLAKRFSKREVSGVDPEYTNFVQDILMRVGQHVRRSVQDLSAAIASGEHADLASFIAGKEAGLREVPIADFLQDPNFRKPLDQLTAAEFRAVHDSIKTLVKNGRDELKIYKEGAEADLQTIKDQIVDQLKTLPEKVVGPPKGIKHTARTTFAALLQMEALLNRFDRGNPKGVLSQYVMRGLSEAASYERDLERKYGKALTAIKDKVDLYEQIDNPLFIEPHSVEQNAKGVPNFDDPNGRPMPFTREKLRAVMLYLGRQEGRDKIARGHGVDINNVLQWVNTKATKQDWDWVQKVWDIFDKVKKEADQMYRNLSGVAPKSSEPIEIQTPHGTYRGGYYPIRYSPEFVGTSSKLKGPEALEQNNYVRATTPAGYTKKVTGYAAPLDLQLGNLGNHLRGMLHDIAFRPSVIEASKIFYDTRVQNTITKHYGLPYKNLLVPYLKDVANSANFRSDAQVVGARTMEFFRQNIIGTLIGLNPGTVAKHGPTAAMNSITEVGPVNFLKAVKDLLQTNDATGESNWRFAMDSSAELRSRHRNYEETLQGSQAQALGETSLRQTLMKFQATPVAISDLLSAVPTWLAKYRSEMQDHGVPGDAIYAADRAVRRAHGSVAITNRPALMRGGALAQWMTSLYGFFSHMLNRQYELMWRAADSIEGIKKGELDTFKQNAPQLMAGLFSYVIFPALVEEMVTPLTNDQKESWGKWMGKTLLKGVSSSWPLVREFADFALSNQRREPTTGLLTTSMKAVLDAIKDVSRGKESFSKQHAGATIQHGLTALGAMTGLANAQEGKILRFTHDYATGLAQPKGMGDVIRGLRYGTMEKR